MRLTISVRAATPADAAGVAAVLEASYPRLMAAAYAPELLARALPLMVRPNPALLASGTYYVAEMDYGAVVGCGGWTRERPGCREVEPGLAHIRHFATRAESAGRGVGRAIYRRCEAQALAAGITVFECYASLNAERFYAALGFAAVGRFDVPLGGSLLLPSVVMRRFVG